MKLKRGKAKYTVPLVEQLKEVIIQVKDKYYLLEMVDSCEIERTFGYKGLVCGIPKYFSYIGMSRGKAEMCFCPAPDKAYEAKCRYILTKEF